MDPAQHYKLGQVLSSFREDNIAIISSGQITHNMRALMGGGNPSVKAGNHAFVEWFKTVMNDPDMTTEERRDALINWTKAPGARDTHPREEHLMPYIVAAGAAEGEIPETILDTWAEGIDCMAFINLMWS